MKFKEKTQEPIEELKECSKKDCALSDKIVELLVKQLGHELYNHNLYRSFANYFGVNGLIILEQYYIKRAEEEKKHHDWIIDYLSFNDAAVIYPEIPAIKEEWDDFVTPFELTVEKEIETTDLIDEIINTTMEEKDWGTFGWLMGNGPVEGRLRPEQGEEMSISRTALDIANQEGSWLRKEKSIMDAYEKDYD